MSESGALPRAVETVAALRAGVARWRAAGASPVGVVPTMGYLHDGHMALVAASRASCARTVVTIFVNPAQFGPGEDLATYPRDLGGDLAKLAAAGVDAVFTPATGEMYPPGFATTVSVAGLADGLCGAARPGHFAGVATVVCKLFLQCGADRAFFGEKDYQQLKVVARMARDLDIPTEVVAVPTVREADGLAVSSRNVRLTEAQRAVAPRLARALAAFAAAVAQGADAAAEAARGRAALAAAGFDRVDYLECRDAETLTPVARAGGAPARVFAAARLGEVRLIDNLPVPAAPAGRPAERAVSAVRTDARYRRA